MPTPHGTYRLIAASGKPFPVCGKVAVTVVAKEEIQIVCDTGIR